MSFDAQSFLDAAVTTANDTKLIPVPMGEYTGVIEKIAPRPWQSQDGTQSGVSLDVTWIVEDENVKALLGRTSVTVRQNIMLDVTPEGSMDMSKGKNVGIGRLREAVGKNTPGESFSFAMLPGLMAKIDVKHREYKGDMFAEVKAVAKM